MTIWVINYIIVNGIVLYPPHDKPRKLIVLQDIEAGRERLTESIIVCGCIVQLIEIKKKHLFLGGLNYASNFHG